MLTSKQVFNVGDVGDVGDVGNTCKQLTTAAAFLCMLLTLPALRVLRGVLPPISGLTAFNAPNLQTAQKVLVVNKCYPP